MFELDEIDNLPTALKKRLDTLSLPDGCCQRLMKQKASFHEWYVSIYYKQKLKRKRKSYEKQKTENEGPSRKITRLSETLKVLSKHTFCWEKVNPQLELHESLSFPTRDRVKAVAEDLEGVKLLGRFSEGDMIAKITKYQGKYISNLFNRDHKHKRKTEQPNIMYMILLKIWLEVRGLWFSCTAILHSAF